MGDTTKFVMGFEGQIYIAPAGVTSHTDTQNGAVLFENLKDPKIKPGYEEVDATMRRHGGDKAYLHGLRAFEVSFTMPNVKKIITTNDVESIVREPDVQLAYEALMTRNKSVTLFLLDDDIANGGEGVYGEVLLFAENKDESSGEVQAWEITAKPSAHGRGFRRYLSGNGDKP